MGALLLFPLSWSSLASELALVSGWLPHQWQKNVTAVPGVGSTTTQPSIRGASVPAFQVQRPRFTPGTSLAHRCRAWHPWLWPGEPNGPHLGSLLLPLGRQNSLPWYHDVMGCMHAQLCLTLFNPLDYSPARFLCLWNFPGKNAGMGFSSSGDLHHPGIQPSCRLHWQVGSLPLSCRGSLPGSTVGLKCKIEILSLSFMIPLPFNKQRLSLLQTLPILDIIKMVLAHITHWFLEHFKNRE